MKQTEARVGLGWAVLGFGFGLRSDLVLVCVGVGVGLGVGSLYRKPPSFFSFLFFRCGNKWKEMGVEWEIYSTYSCSYVLSIDRMEWI